MKPARTWDGVEGRFYKSGIPSDFVAPYGKLELNVRLDNGDVLLKHFMRFYNEHGASLYEDPETIIGMIPKERIRIIADVNEIIYQFLPCNTWKGFCDYLSEIRGIEPRLSGNYIEIPNVSVTGKAGNIFRGTLTACNKDKKTVKVLLDSELLGSPFISFDFEEPYVREIKEGNEILYSGSPLKKEDVFRAVTSNK